MPGLLRSDPVPLPSIMANKNGAPAVQAPNSPPKKVGFTSYVTASRERTETEAWSFYWFETHCRECRQCRDPYAVYKRGDHLCSKGEILARDMAIHVYMREGEIYERVSSSPQDPDRVEIPHNYHYLQGQLKAIEKMERRARRHSRRPVVDVDQAPLRRSDERHREDRYYQSRYSEDKPRSDKKYDRVHQTERAELVVEAPRSSDKAHDNKDGHRRRRHRHSSKYEDEERREKEYVLDERPTEEKEYRREEKYHHERRHSKELEREVIVEDATTGKDTKYRTEIREPEKPEKERRRRHYH